MKNITGAILVSFALTACASIVGKSNYPVSLRSDPAGAAIVIKNGTGTVVYQGVTPTIVTLTSSAGFFQGENYTVSFTMDGFPERSTVIERNISGWYFGNLLLGGFIGMLIVDPATGAMWTLNTNVHLKLDDGSRLDHAEKNAAPAQAHNDNSVRIVMLDDIPQSERVHLVRVSN